MGCKKFVYKVIFFLGFSLFGFALNSFAQTPITQYECDPRSTANGGVCPVDCAFAANIERGCNCFDNIDNDGDGKTDAADPKCAPYFGLEFIGAGSDCSITPPGANTPFDLVGPPAVSGQNTADTQSKVAAGDVDGNGTPDVVITSKWNSEVRLVATSVQTGSPQFGGDNFDPGDIKADFRLTGGNTNFFNAFEGISVRNLLFEHEVLIADINKDGVAEIFCVVSNRHGAPTSPPRNFYLIALRVNDYGPNGLVAMYDAIYLGKNRPGTFGIADMDGDGKAEIYLRDRIFAAETGKLLASPLSKLMTGTGTDDWDVDVPSSPVAIDIKTAGADGNVMELVTGPKIYKIPNLTNRNPVAPAALTLWRDMNTISFDINGDAAPDQYFIKLMNDPAEYGIDTHSSASVADIDKDGFVDVVLTGALNSSGGRTTVFYWNVQDNTVTGFMTPTSAMLGIPPATTPDYNNYLNGWIWGTGRINIGDADGDGNLDLLFVAGNQLFCLNHNVGTNALTQKWLRTINDSRSGVLTVTIYDFDNDGNPEVVYRDSQELVIIDGATGANNLFSRTCRSHTYTEGPIIADVNGDGNTDICVSCNRSDNPAQFNINAGIQQQALGEVRIWFSDGEWLPTRQVWNQPGYFVVNINDDLTLPFPQFDIAVRFDGNCVTGPPGERMPFNVFLNQVPFLSATGCPVFPAPDLTFIGDDPNDPGADPTDPNFFPTVFVDPNICGNLDLRVGFNITNSGDLPINTSIPVSFFIGSPYDVGNPGTLLHNTTIPVTNLQVGDTLSIGDYTNSLGNVRPGDIPFIEFDGPGTQFELFVVLYNDGSILPIDTLSGNSGGQTQSGQECDITNNFWPVQVVPKPFTVNIDSVDDVRCLPTSPPSGELISHISVGVDTVLDLSPYAFQWYQSDQVTPIPGETNYNITGLADGDYYLVITNTEKGCVSDPILGQVQPGALVIPGLAVTKLSDQTSCEPPNGSLQADVTGGNAGFEFSWEDVGGPIGVTGPLLENVRAGTYTVVVTQTGSGCSTSADGTILDFTQEPEVEARADSVFNCLNAMSGAVTATASSGGVVQDSTLYRFDWYFFDFDPVSNTFIRGSILPGSTGNPTVKDLGIGFYEVVITELATGCNEANLAPDTVEVKDRTFIPEVFFTELAPQTSCDPLQPNGRMQADAVFNGVTLNPADFTFEWFEGQNTITPHLGGTSGVNEQIGENLKGGGQAYTVRITTANSCSVTRDTIVTEVIVFPQVALVNTPNSVCDPTLGFTGSVSSTVTFNGNPVSAPDPNYSFKWYNGAIANPAMERVPDFNKQNITALDSGFYTLVVTNELLHCPSVANVEQVLSTKALPAVVTSSLPSTNCDPALANGVAQVTNVDGGGPSPPNYTFEWYDGNIVAGPVMATTPAYGVNTPGNGLQGGAGQFYTVKIRNTIFGCENTAVVGVADAKVIPVLTLTAQDNDVCDPAFTSPPRQYSGEVTASVTNQVGALTDYSFVFGGGNTVGVQAANVYDQLNGGPIAYTAVATHTPSGCVSSQVSIPVQNVLDLPDLVTGSVPSSNCVAGLEDGEASIVTVDGVAAPGVNYTYAWTGPAAFPVTNGVNNANTFRLIKLQGGSGFDYSVLVTNQTNGCQANALVNVSDVKVIPVVTLSALDNGICDPTLTAPLQQFTGRVTATVTNQVGALADYSFVFGGGNTAGVQAANVYNQLNGGPVAYTADVTHTPSGCVSSQVSIPVQNVLDLPDLVTGSVPSTNCVAGLEDGQARVVTVDGIAAPATNYTYAWTGPAAFPVTIGTNNANTFQLIKLQGGAGFDYSVLVTNQTNGCQASALVNVSDAKVIPLLSLTPVPNSICDPATAGIPFDGQVSAAVTNIPGGSNNASYFFDWSVGADGNGVTVLPGLDVGTYSVTALHNPTGCISALYSAQVTDAKELPSIVTTQTPSQNCAMGAPDGIASVTAVLPNGKTYDYRWYDGNTVTGTADFTDLNSSLTTSDYVNVQGGLNGAALFQYTVQVIIRETGCENSAVVAVNDDSQLPIVTLNSTDNINCVVPKNGSASINTFSYRGSPVASPYTGFTFNWSAGGVVGPAPGDTYLQLAAGTYTVTVTNTDDNCTSNPVAIDVNDNLFTPVIDVLAVDQTSCDLSNPNGSLTASIDETGIGGGTGIIAGYNFVWTDDVTSGTTSSNQITGLKGNQTYTIDAVRISTGCQNSQVITLDENITIPVVSTVVTDLTQCVPPNGSISASVVPASTYDFFWYDGNDAVDENAVIAGASQAGPSSVYANLVPGNYTVVARDVNTLCVSNLIINTVNDASPPINIAIVNTSLPTDCNAVNSQMDATANGGTAGFIFEWYSDVPQPTDPSLGSINYFTNPPVYTPPATVAAGFQVLGLLSGLYTLEVTDQATGCKKFQPHSLPFQNSHAVIKITKTDSELCPYTIGNGSVTIEIENPIAPPPPVGTDQTSYNVFLYQAGVQLVTLLSPSDKTTEPVNPFLVSNTLVPGSYTVGVQETYSGSNCFIYQDVVIDAVALDPLISLTSSIVSNTACDVSQFDGQIDITVDKDPNDPVLGLTYDIDMVADPNNNFPITGVASGNYSAPNLGPGTYTFNVTASNGCASSRAFTVLNNPVVSQFVGGDLSVSNAQYCDPALEQNARIVINNLSVIGGGPEILADYEFHWDDVTGSITDLFVLQGDAINSLSGGDEFINQVPLPTSGTVPAGTVKAGTYRVRAVKTLDASGTGGIGCSSAPFSITIGSNKVNPQLTLTPTGDTSCDPTFFEGSIEVDATTPSGPGVGGTYTYQWTPNGGAGEPVNSAGNSGIDNIFTGLNDGNYSLLTRNETTGCFVSLSTTISRQAPPVFSVTATPFNLTNCGPFDGRIENLQVFINGAPGLITDFDYSWYRGNLTTEVIDGLDDITYPVDDQLTLATYPAIALGSYFVKATRKSGNIGVGCESAPVRRDILDDRIFPQVDLSQISNTACDGNFDGQITVSASTSGGPGVGANYDFIWTSDPDGAGPLFSASDAPDQASPYSTPNTDLIGPGSYTIQVTNVVTSCLSTGTIVMQTNTVPMEIVSVVPTHVDVCLPMLANGSGTVTDVSIGGSPGQSGLFTFTWADNVGMGSPILSDDLALTLMNLDAGNYFVRATRNALVSPATPGVTGSGCFTSPIPFVVEDRRVTPSVSLSQISNTACDGNFDGQITVSASTASGPGVGANYDFIWTSDPDGAGPLFSASDALNQASPYSTPNTDLIGPGSYTVQVTNVATSCSTSGSISLQQNDAIILVVNASKTDQDICDFDGSILVGDVSINGMVDPDHNNFNFTWYTVSPTNLPPIINQVQGEDFLDVSNYNIEAGTYFVVASRSTGLTGSGCESAPFRVDIQDISVNPIPTLKAFSNSTCTVAFLNGAIKIEAKDNTGPGVGSLYDYEYIYNDGFNPPVGPVFVFGNNGNGINDADLDSLISLQEGSYSFVIRNQVTQCTTPAQITIQYDPIASKPNIVSVDKNFPINCLGNGGDATVTSIRIGSNAALTGSPTLDPPNFGYDWYDNGIDPFLNPAPPGNVAPVVPLGRMLTMLTAGTYYVTVRDLLTDCKSTPTQVVIDSVDITYPSVLIRQTVLQLSCDITNGTAELEATADGQNDTNATYTFTWFNSLDGTGTTIPDPWLASQSTITLLTSGDYSVTALNSLTGCSTTKLFIIPPFDPKFFPNIAVSGDPQSSCLVPNGSVVVRVIPFPVVNGLTYDPPFNFSVDLYLGDQTSAGLDQDPPLLPPDIANIPALPFSPQPGSFIADPLDDGVYTVRLLDTTTGCIVVEKTEVLDDRRRPTPTIVLDNPLTNCDTRFNGQLSANADGRSVGDYDFYWWSELNNPPSVGDTITTNHKLIGQDQGRYFVNIVNKASGCDTLASGVIPTNQILPQVPSIELIQPQTICWEPDPKGNFPVNDVSYPGNQMARPNGWLRANVNGVTIGYSFEWFAGEFDNQQVVGLTPDTVGINNIHLISNVYTVKSVILTTGCSNVASRLVPDERIIPTGIVDTTPSFCEDARLPSGSVILQQTNEQNVSLRQVTWFEEDNNAYVGDGIQVFELPPGFYRAEFISNEFCYGESVGNILTEILAYNLVSENADGSNDVWIIDCISNFTIAAGAARDNNVKVFNRNGVLVYEADAYNNSDVVFKGIGENGQYLLGGRDQLPDGTYFFVIDKRDGSKPITGFLELVR